MQICKSCLIKPRFQVVMKEQRESQPQRNVLTKQSQWNPSLHEQTERISLLLFCFLASLIRLTAVRFVGGSLSHFFKTKVLHILPGILPFIFEKKTYIKILPG